MDQDKSLNRKMLARQIFFSKQVHTKEWKDNMSGENEDQIIKILNFLGFKQDVDYERQYPFGGTFVVDFAFIPEQVALEVDGASHNNKKKKRLDDIRDRYFIKNNWVVLRIPDKKLKDPYMGSMYKSLIKEVILERRKQREDYKLLPLDLSRFIDEVEYHNYE